MLKIWSEDINWTNDDGQIIAMSNPSCLYLNSRLVHSYLPPVITEDTWNGRTFPVQIDIWNSYQVHFSLKEISLQQIQKIQICQKLYLESLTTNEIIIVDTKASGGISIEPGGRLGSVDQSFIMTFRTNRTVTYPGLARLNTNNLRIVIGANTYNYYTDYDIISYIEDTEKSDYSYDNGIKYTAKTINRQGKQLIFYLMETDAVALKEYLETAAASNIVINPLTDNTVSLETGVCKLTQLTEGLYKCECTIITEVV